MNSLVWFRGCWGWRGGGGALCGCRLRIVGWSLNTVGLLDNIVAARLFDGWVLKRN